MPIFPLRAVTNEPSIDSPVRTFVHTRLAAGSNSSGGCAHAIATHIALVIPAARCIIERFTRHLRAADCCRRFVRLHLGRAPSGFWPFSPSATGFSPSAGVLPASGFTRAIGALIAFR